MKKEEEVLNGPNDIKILKIAKAGLNTLSNVIISRYEKLLQKFSHALPPYVQWDIADPHSFSLGYF